MGGIEESGFTDNFLPTFVVNVLLGVVDANEQAIALLNRNSSYVVRLWAANIFSVGTTAVIASLMNFKLKMFTATAALIGGTAATPASMDPGVDSLPGSIDVRRNPTETADWVKGESFRYCHYSPDEPVVSRADANFFSSQVFPRDSYMWYRPEPRWVKPPTMRVRSDGITFDGVTIENGSIGAVAANIGMQLTFTVEPA